MLETLFIFAYFLGKGNSGMHLAFSEDGFNWSQINNGEALIAPVDGLMRDPFLYYSEEENLFHLIWTTAWNSQTIGHSTSSDLINWSEQQKLPVMAGVEGVRNCWAPEMIYDTQTESYVIYWASTVKGMFEETDGISEDDYNHRMWYTKTKDFQTFEPAKVFLDPGYSVIDSTMTPNGDEYVLITKDERLVPEKKHLFVSTAKSPEGPWITFSERISDSWVEGPAFIDLGTEKIIVFDRYRQHQYGALSSNDFKTWTDVSEKMNLPEGARHGSIIKINRAKIQDLFKSK